MISFQCSCNSKISVPAELAGSMIQCPDCKRLNDVPLESEIGLLEEDGSYKVEEAPKVSEDDEALSRIVKAFTRDHHDEYGEPIDNRGVFGVAPEPAAEPPKRIAPRYDPTTGELIREVNFKPVEVTPVVPLALPLGRQIKRSYDIDAPERFELIALPAKLLAPMNLLVMGFIFLGLMLAQAMVMAIVAFYWTLAFIFFILHAVIIAHFANVVDETGPTNRSELPTPGRNLNLGEDTFGPFCWAMICLAICYGPGLVLLFTARNAPLQIVVGLSLALTIAGTLAFPVVLLTVLTSGTVLNLRPDRLLATAMVCGPDYLLALITWCMAAVSYVFGVFSTTYIAIAIVHAWRRPPWAKEYIAVSVLAASVYLMHLFGWQLGIIYRKYHARFPWIYQRHNRDAEVVAQPTGFAVKRLPKGHAPTQMPLRTSPIQSSGGFPEITE